MAYQIIVKKRFTNKVQKVLVYLEKEWSHKVAADFLIKIDRRIELLTKQPFVGKSSSKIKNVRVLLITRHNKLYYIVKDDKVIILNMYDTRMNPKKNPFKNVVFFVKTIKLLYKFKIRRQNYARIPTVRKRHTKTGKTPF
jgi:plasmid stabilization system protein ParE